MSFSIQPSDHDFAKALAALKEGGIVAYPTETFYGLAVDPSNDRAIASLYELKKREGRKALSLLVPNLEYLSGFVSLCPSYKKLIYAFWPGPLTLIFPVLTNVSAKLCGDRKDIAIRVSSNTIAQRLCTSWGRAITATSANISGEPALVSADEVKSLWGNNIDYILDGGVTPGGCASTIVRCNDSKRECHFIREGAICCEAIINILPSNYTICKG
jgi:L-threonylcarbamoyladenylate synthase